MITHDAHTNSPRSGCMRPFEGSLPSAPKWILRDCLLEPRLATEQAEQFGDLLLADAPKGTAVILEATGQAVREGSRLSLLDNLERIQGGLSSDFDSPSHRELRRVLEEQIRRLRNGLSISEITARLDELKREDLEDSGLVLPWLKHSANESVKALYREALRGAEKRLTDACATGLGVSNRLLNFNHTGPSSWHPGIFGGISHREQVQLVRVAAPTAGQVHDVRGLLGSLTDAMRCLSEVNDRALKVINNLQDVVEESTTRGSRDERRTIRNNLDILKNICHTHLRAVSEEAIRARFFGQCAETSSSLERFEMFVSYWKAVWSSLDTLQEVMTQSRDARRTAQTESTSTQGHDGFDSKLQDTLVPQSEGLRNRAHLLIRAERNMLLDFGPPVFQALRASGKGWKENCEAVTRGLQEAREQLQRDAAYFSRSDSGAIGVEP